MKKAQTIKSPEAEKRLIEEPTLNNLNHIYKLYEEFDSDNKNVEDIVKGENNKNLKEKGYTNMDKEKEGKQADLLNKKKPRNHHDISRKRGEMRKPWLPRKWHCQTLGKTFS